MKNESTNAKLIYSCGLWFFVSMVSIMAILFFVLFLIGIQQSVTAEPQIRTTVRGNVDVFFFVCVSKHYVFLCVSSL